MTTTDETTPAAPEPAPASTEPAASTPGPAPAPGVPATEPAPAPEVPAAPAPSPDGEAGPDCADSAPAPETPEATAARQAVIADGMTAGAMLAPLGAALAPPLAMALAENTRGDDMAILAPLWPAWQACRAITEGECAALLDEWSATAQANTFAPLAEWVSTGRHSVPAETAA